MSIYREAGLPHFEDIIFARYRKAKKDQLKEYSRQSVIFQIWTAVRPQIHSDELTKEGGRWKQLVFEYITQYIQRYPNAPFTKSIQFLICDYGEAPDADPITRYLKYRHGSHKRRGEQLQNFLDTTYKFALKQEQKQSPFVRTP